VREFVRQEIGDRHAYQWALHVPTAADGGEQPHFHLMFSERQVDGIDRDPEQYFKRYNAKAPEKGGARKGYGPSAGQTLTKAERAAELKELRGRWEAMCNAHLERAGVEQRIDMRSHAERGTGLEPERKQLPSAWRGEGRAQVIEFRAARAEVAQAAAELRRAVPDTGAEIIHLEAERQRREQAQREARERAEREKAQQERQRLERMSSRELAQEIARLRPPRVIDLVERDRAVLQAEAERQALQNQHTEAGSAAARAR
ncbi:MobA/MobL family protein, partial [Escherichia coli]